MPLVSVVIPAYNCSKYIKETISSILNQQSEADLEIIVIDDGSTDDTADIVRAIGNPVRIISQKNAGVCAARNRGIKEAKGEFIALVDHDDYWLPNKLAVQLAVLENNPQADVVFSAFQRWLPNSGASSFCNPLDYSFNADSKDIDGDFSGWIYHQMLLDSWVLTSTALARSSVIVASGGFDETLPFSEDWDFWLRISRVSQLIKLRGATTLYRQHPQQGSRVTRPIDYRTRLLEDAARKWGLCSPDGRCIGTKQFRRQLAMYCASFGLGHLRGGRGSSRKTAAKSLLKAWSIDCFYWRSLAYLGAMAVGWKPKW